MAAACAVVSPLCVSNNLLADAIALLVLLGFSVVDTAADAIAIGLDAKLFTLFLSSFDACLACSCVSTPSALCVCISCPLALWYSFKKFLVAFWCACSACLALSCSAFNLPCVVNAEACSLAEPHNAFRSFLASFSLFLAASKAVLALVWFTNILLKLRNTLEPISTASAVIAAIF